MDLFKIKKTATNLSKYFNLPWGLLRVFGHNLTSLLGFYYLGYDSGDLTLTYKDNIITYAGEEEKLKWTIDCKLFFHGSQDSVVIIKDDNSGGYLSVKQDASSSSLHKNGQRKVATYFEMLHLEKGDQPWNRCELKWILRFNIWTTTDFSLISMKNPNLRLLGRAENKQVYLKTFDWCCDADLHINPINQYYHVFKNDQSSDKVICETCKVKCHKLNDGFTKDLKERACDCRFFGTCQISDGCINKFSDIPSVKLFKCKKCSSDNL